MITLKDQKKPYKPLCHIVKSALTKKPAYCTYSTYSIGAYAARLTRPQRLEIVGTRDRACRKKTGAGDSPGGIHSLQANHQQTANQGRANIREIEGAGVASSIQAKGQTAA